MKYPVTTPWIVLLCLMMTFWPNCPSAKYAAIVIDARSGKSVHEEAADKTVHPASLTKMMTLFKTFKALDEKKLTLNHKLRISPHAAAQGASKLGLKPGQSIRVQDAIMALVTKSANDSAVVLAEALAKSERHFANSMTQQARDLGMHRTVFHNASGWPHAKQITTARDMARLSKALIDRFPHYYKYFATKVFQYKGIPHHNHNKLVGEVIGHKDDIPIIVDGIKTGFTNASGFNLAASARHKNRRLIAVVMGGPNRHWRDQRVRELLQKAFGVRAPQPAKLQFVSTAKNKPNKKKTAQGVTQKTLQKQLQGKKGGAGSMAEALPLTKGWRIQVGAFKRSQNAQDALSKARHYVKTLHSVQGVTVPVGKKNKIYQAQFVKLSPQQAQQSCATLKKKGIDCIVMANSASRKLRRA